MLQRYMENSRLTKVLVCFMKGVKLEYLPPILMIQLKRFEYNFQEEKNVKILAALEYEEELNFSRWSISPEEDIYQLYAVLVHEGARA